VNYTISSKIEISFMSKTHLCCIH